jgi:hypothetical protein
MGSPWAWWSQVGGDLLRFAAAGAASGAASSRSCHCVCPVAPACPACPACPALSCAAPTIVEGFSLWFVVVVALWASASGLVLGIAVTRLLFTSQASKVEHRDVRHIGGRGILGIRAN